MSYPEVIRALEARVIMPDGPPSLVPMQQGLDRILKGMVLDPRDIIVVAGTNGKGSVSATLEALLLDAGETVGLYTSPHLEETTERVRINGSDVSPEVFSETYQNVDLLTHDMGLSHFEMLTLMAVWIFRVRKDLPRIRWLIFEVGLGGTWDATNAIPHHYNVITSLGFDHQNLLGNTLTEIAANKFGIIRDDSIVIHSEFPDEVKPLAREVQAKTQSKWVPSVPFAWSASVADQVPTFNLQTQWGTAPLSLPGRRGAQNAATALTLFHELGYDPARYLSALTHVRWSGRMERVQKSKNTPPIYLSGDHNPQGVQSLLEILEFYPRHHLHILAGVGKDKDLEGILAPLSRIQDASLYLTETPFRGRPVDSYGEWLKQARGAWADPKVALQNIIEIAQPSDMILITGSLYLVGALKRELRALDLY
jgi:dihydrofolate synthase/folylpolyglutamate synthase